MRHSMLKQIIVIISVFLLPINSWSQDVKSNAANVNDPKIIFVSPASLSMIPTAQFVAGYQMYYPGISSEGLRNGFGAFSLPLGELGTFGVNGQYFTSFIFRKGNVSLGYSKTLFDERISFGFDVGIYYISYNQENFQLVHQDDPVFRRNSSKNMLDIGFGILVNPLSRLYLGIAAKHLNQPNVSLIDDDIKIPTQFNIGLMYDHPLVNPLIDIEYSDNNLDINFGVERWLLKKNALLRLNYNQYNLGAAAALIFHSSGYWLRFEYEYKYPLSDLKDVANDFHQFMFTYGFAPKRGDFELIIQPAKQTIYVGEMAGYNINIVQKDGFEKPVDIQLSGLGIKTSIDYSFSSSSALTPTQLNKNESSIITFNTSLVSRPGAYEFTITGSSDDREKKSSITLEILKLPVLSGEVLTSVDTLIIQETTKILSRDPLLPYIFFDESQSSLSAERFEIINPKKNPVQNFIFFPDNLLDIPSKYRNTLNIIAKRLWENPRMKIVVHGYNSGWGDEAGNLELSKRRAEEVRDYLVENCGVRFEQVAIEAHQTPGDPANNEDPRGREENQRVEITCPIKSQSILEPILSETSEITTSDSTCSFQFRNLLVEAGMEKWKIIIVQAPDDTFKVFEGRTIPKSNLVWDWKNETGQSVKIDKKYRYRLCLWDSIGQTYTSNWKEIQIRKISKIEREYIQKEIEKSRLILFKYDRAEMDLSSTALQQELVVIVKKLKTDLEATLLIQGHTDIIGQPNYNTALSNRRAESVVDYFTGYGISEYRISYQGFGITKPLMDNNLPEGRMMNRRVEIYLLH